MDCAVIYSEEALADLGRSPHWQPRKASHQAAHWINSWVVGVSEILEEIKSLPTQQRWEILQRTREMLDAEIPESFKQGMREIARGEVIELDEALEELDKPE